MAETGESLLLKWYQRLTLRGVLVGLNAWRDLGFINSYDRVKSRSPGAERRLLLTFFGSTAAEKISKVAPGYLKAA